MQKNELPPPAVVYEPLRLVCSQLSNNDVKVLALGCIAHLFTFSYLEDYEEPEEDPATGITPPPQIPMLDRAIKTVCDCFNGEKTDPRVELQIIKALMSAVLNDEIVAHGATLLKAIRQVYTIFVVSSSTSNQTTTQATLTQMIDVVFERVKSLIKRSSVVPLTPSIAISSSSLNLDQKSSSNSSSSSIANVEEKLTLRQMESRGSNEVERVREDFSISENSEAELFAKDAFLVFRTLCRLSEKRLESEDPKSQGLRSKLLSLHLIHSILKSHMTVFLSNEIIIKSQSKGEETFLVSIKDYLCSTLARNAASILPSIFEISAEIFWIILSNLRFQFKWEIEVFFTEIYFPITEMKTSTSHQKQYFLSIIQKLSNDPRALVEIYLNYDCDNSTSLNIYEAIIDFLVKVAVSPVHLTNVQFDYYSAHRNRSIAHYNLSLPPAIAISNIASAHGEDPSFPVDFALKMTALESLVAVLRSLFSWAQRGVTVGGGSSHKPSKKKDLGRSDSSQNEGEYSSGSNSTNTSNTFVDDPTQFQSLKIRKTALQEAVRLFNIKPKKGIAAFISSGIIEDNDPVKIAELLLNTEGLDKALIGDYLGEGDEENIKIMHAFVDLIDFSNMKFVDALRLFLQTFRLPGEAQKIDRFMLKFAERYIAGNPGVFANADTAYVLAYSVIMLNTDLHSAQIKVRMTVDDFIKNNRGINDNCDLPDEYLIDIFTTIQNDEIKLLSEQHAALLSSDGQTGSNGFGGIGQALATVGRNLQREAYVQASREMANKTAQLFKSFMYDGKRKNHDKFYTASHVEHVKPMFKVAWMSFLAGLSEPFQESNDPETIKLCLEGFKYSIKIACLFDVELARISFVSALSKFTNLQNLSEMKHKNVEAVRLLLNIAETEGDNLGISWKDILTCISQLERFQLIFSGIEAGTIPDVTNARFINSRNSIDTMRTARTSTAGSIFSGFGFRSHSNTSNSGNRSDMQSSVYLPEVGEELQAREIIISMDKIFTKSASLSGKAIVDFVRALTEVSWEEIQSSGSSEHPRTFSLQKMVDVSYYNMERVRIEWSQLWAIMGKSFNQVGCHDNTNVVFFALDSLRQLSIRFFDLDELSFFMFQKDFLKPFEYVMGHNDNTQVCDMVLQCLKQMVLAKSEKIKSGWRTMFSTFTVAVKKNNATAGLAAGVAELAVRIQRDHFDQLIQQDAFGGFVGCLSSLGKNPRFQKPSLQAMDLLKGLPKKIIPYSDKDTGDDELYNKYWFPVLYSLHDVIMNGEDLEVRSRALNYMFDILIVYGNKFSGNFWDTIGRQLLFPIFTVLRSKTDMAKFGTAGSNNESDDNLSVWLSTTMVQALRNMVALVSHYFEMLNERMLDGVLELLVTCVLQENETVSRIGSSCLLKLVEDNVEKLSEENWALIVDKFEVLFEATTAAELFDGGLSHHRSPPVEAENSDISGSSASSSSLDTSSAASRLTSKRSVAKLHKRVISWAGPDSQSRQEKFRKTIVKCILQLLLIDLVQDMFFPQSIAGNQVEPTSPVVSGSGWSSGSSGRGRILELMPLEQTLRILALLKKSYTFSNKFNADKQLRVNLFKEGLMKQMPNLAKQETFSVLVFLTLCFSLIAQVDTESGSDTHEKHKQLLAPVKADVVAISYDIVERFGNTTNNNWDLVLVGVLDGLADDKGFPQRDFIDLVFQPSPPQQEQQQQQQRPSFYDALLDLLDLDLAPELRLPLKLVLRRAHACSRAISV